METSRNFPEMEAYDVKFELPSNILEGFNNRARITPPAPSGWDNDATELLKTIHGSTLYGLNHAGSDEDYYVVVPSRFVGRQVRRQSIVNGVDTVVVDFKTFNKMAEAGVPQALEAMFSRETVSEYFEDYRTRYYASSSEVVHTYLRTMKAFALNDREDQFKMRRHSLRLAYNLEELLYTGRFNPTLPKRIIEQVNSYARKDFRSYVKELKSFTPIQVEWGESLQQRLAET